MTKILKLANKTGKKAEMPNKEAKFNIEAENKLK